MIFFCNLHFFGGPLSNKLKSTGVAGPVTKTGIARVRHPVMACSSRVQGLGFEKMTGTFCLETRRVVLPTKCEGIKILTISNRFFLILRKYIPKWKIPISILGLALPSLPGAQTPNWLLSSSAVMWHWSIPWRLTRYFCTGFFLNTHL